MVVGWTMVTVGFRSPVFFFLSFSVPIAQTESLEKAWRVIILFSLLISCLLGKYFK